MKDVTPIRLAKWLAAQAPSDIVGRTHAPCSCPLANCLMALNDSDHAEVNANVHLISTGYGQSQYVANKRWHKMFISRVDWLNHRIINSPVSASEARDILVDVTPPRYLTQVKHILGITD